MKNLLKLSYSSIFALKKTALVILGLAIVITISNKDGSMLPFGSALLIMMLNYNSIAYESNSKSDFLIYALPVKPQEYILSKYIFGFINIILAVIFSDILHFVINIYGGISSGDFTLTEVNTAVLLTGLIIVDIVVPIAIIVGFNKARIFLVFLTLLPVCFASSIVSALSALHISQINMPMAAIEMIILGAGAVLTIISYFVTAKLYAGKDIN